MIKRNFKYIYNFMRPYLLWELIGLFIVIGATFLTQLNPYISKNIIDDSLFNKSVESLVKNLILIASIFVATQALSVLKTYIFTYISERLQYDMRMSLYRKITKKDIMFFNKIQTGELMARVMSEVPTVVTLFAGTTVKILSHLTSLVTALIIMFSINIYITLIVLIIIPVVYIVFKISNPKLRQINTQMMEEYSKVNNTLQTNLTNIKTIKYFKAFLFSEIRLSRSFHSYIDKAFVNLKINNILSVILSFVYFCPGFLISLLGGYLVIKGQMTIGGMFALSTYSATLFDPIREISMINVELQRSIATFKRYRDIVGCDEDNREKRVDMQRIKEGIEFKNLSFSYPEKDAIINSLNLFIPVGNIVHFRGQNGSGKSTLADLTCGILDPSCGYVYYDGTDVRTISDKSMKKLVSVISQRLYIFDDSIKNNIKLGRPINDDAIHSLSTALGVEDVIQGKEINLDTKLSGAGNNLSGGQAQKISVLRALVNNSQVVILDEAATYLDMYTKEQLFKYLNHNRKDKIIIIISHEESLYVTPDITLNMDDLKGTYPTSELSSA